MGLIYSGSWRTEEEKMQWWKLHPRGVFNVRSYYRALQSPNSVSFPWKPLWKPKAPK